MARRRHRTQATAGHGPPAHAAHKPARRRQPARARCQRPPVQAPARPPVGPVSRGPTGLAARPAPGRPSALRRPTLPSAACTRYSARTRSQSYGLGLQRAGGRTPSYRQGASPRATQTRRSPGQTGRSGRAPPPGLARVRVPAPCCWLPGHTRPAVLASRGRRRQQVASTCAAGAGCRPGWSGAAARRTSSTRSYLYMQVCACPGPGAQRGARQRYRGPARRARTATRPAPPSQRPRVRAPVPVPALPRRCSSAGLVARARRPGPPQTWNRPA